MITPDVFTPFDNENDNRQYSFRKIKKIAAVTSLALAVNFIEISDVEQFQPIGEIIEYDKLAFVSPRRVEVDVSKEAKNYLAENKAVSQIVDTIREKIPLFFTTKTLLVNLILCPAENYSQIEISVVCNVPIDVALEMLDQFDNNWWLGFDKPGKENVVVDVVSYA